MISLVKKHRLVTATHSGWQPQVQVEPLTRRRPGPRPPAGAGRKREGRPLPLEQLAAGRWRAAAAVPCPCPGPDRLRRWRGPNHTSYVILDTNSESRAGTGEIVFVYKTCALYFAAAAAFPPAQEA